MKYIETNEPVHGLALALSKFFEDKDRKKNVIKGKKILLNYLDKQKQTTK